MQGIVPWLNWSVYHRDPVLADLVEYYLMENLPRPFVPATPGYGFGDSGAQLVAGFKLLHLNWLTRLTHASDSWWDCE